MDSQDLTEPLNVVEGVDLSQLHAQPPTLGLTDDDPLLEPIQNIFSDPVPAGRDNDQPPPFPSLVIIPDQPVQEPAPNPPASQITATQDAPPSAQPATKAKRKAPAKPANKTAPKKPRAPAKSKAAAPVLDGTKLMRFTPRTTATFMEWLLYCRNKGWFNSAHAKDYGEAWDYLIEMCIETWPGYRWDFKRVNGKWKVEMRRYRAWQSLFSRYSGIGLDPDTQLPIVSDEHWESFVKCYTTKTYKVEWVRRQPLGDIDVYKQVFFKAKGTGLDIAEASETQQEDMSGAGVSQSFEEDVDDDDLLDDVEVGEEAGEDEQDVGGEKSDEGEEEEDGNESEPSVTTSRRRAAATAAPAMSQAQRHRLATDPDRTPASQAIALVNVEGGGGGKKRSDVAMLGSSMEKAAASLQAPKLPGAADVGVAVDDLQTRFAKKITELEMMACIDYLVNNPLVATMWMRLSESMKGAYVDRWKRGI